MGAVIAAQLVSAKAKADNSPLSGGYSPLPEEAALFPAVLPTYNRADVAFVRGEGSYLFAEDGTRYLDFGSGVGAAQRWYVETAVAPATLRHAAE